MEIQHFQDTLHKLNLLLRRHKRKIIQNNLLQNRQHFRIQKPNPPLQILKYLQNPQSALILINQRFQIILHKLPTSHLLNLFPLIPQNLPKEISNHLHMFTKMVNILSLRKIVLKKNNISQLTPQQKLIKFHQIRLTLFEKIAHTDNIDPFIRVLSGFFQ